MAIQDTNKALSHVYEEIEAMDFRIADVENTGLELREAVHSMEAIEGKVYDLDSRVDMMSSDVDHLMSTHP